MKLERCDNSYEERRFLGLVLSGLRPSGGEVYEEVWCRKKEAVDRRAVLCTTDKDRG